MLILASKSPRRIELLKDAGLDFEIIPSEIKEEIDKQLEKEELTMQIAKTKALDIFSRFPESTVIAADTIVYYNGEVIGKPIDEAHAFEMLRKLSNNTHEVITGVAIINSKEEDIFYDSAKVTIKELSDLEIRDYIKSENPLDKAGSYAIQGLGKNIVESFDGDFFTIMGLPLKKVLNRLNKKTD